MEEQFIIGEFLSPEQVFFNEQLPAFIEILGSNGLTSDSMRFEQKQSYYSCVFNNKLFFRLHFGKKVHWIELPYTFYSIICKYNIKAIVKESECRIDLSDADRESLSFVLSDALNMLIDTCAGGFGCCHRYVECSDEGHCVHPDKAFAVDCLYRVNLKHGKVFYGNNSNN